MPAEPEIRSATDWNEVAQTAVCASRAFPDETAALFHSRTSNAPSLPLENTLLLLLDGEITSSLQIYERRIQFGDRLALAGAIGNVLTLPEYRGKGYASMLLDAAVDFMCKKGYALSLLIGDSSFYSRLGWEPLPDVKHIVTDIPQLPVGEGRWLEFDPDRDLNLLAALRRAELKGIDGSLSRPAYLWREWTFVHLIDPDDVRLYEIDGEIEGYLVATESEGTVVCSEIGWAGIPDGREAFRAACWNALANRTDRVRWDPPLQGLAEANETTSLQEMTCESPMVRVHEAVARSDEAVPSTTAAFLAHLEGTDWYFSDLDKF